MAISDLFMHEIRTVFGVLNDFTPKRTIDEVTRLIGDLRAQMLDAGGTDTRTRLEARRTTVLQAQRVAVQEQGSPQSIRLLQEEGTLLDRLSRPVKIERDVLAGSLDKTGGMLDPVWQPVQAQVSSTTVVLRTMAAAVGPIFKDRQTREQEIQLWTQLQVRAEVLSELRGLISPESRPIVDVKLAAIDRVRAALQPSVRSTAIPPRAPSL